MANMRAIRTRIKSVKNTEQITKAMKMVAVSKLRRTQSSMQAMRPFSEKSQEVMDTLLSASSGLDNRFIKPHKEVKKVCYVLFLGNRGLCGAYNSSILHYANSVIKQGGKADCGVSNFTITDERKKSWDFSTPYRTDYVGLMVKKRSGFTSIEDLDGKVIGVSQGATTQGLIEQMIKDNGFSCKPEFRAFSGYPIIKSSLDAGNIDVFAMDRSTLAGYMNETVELLQPEVKFGEQGYGVATKKGCDLSAVVDQVICDRLADGWLDQEVKTWGLV